MPKFSQESFSKLSTCHIDLQVLFFEVIKTFDCTILVGYRNEVDQDKAYAEGKSKLQYPASSHNHQPSMAVDVTPYPINFSNVALAHWFAGFVMGVAQQLKNEGKMTHSIRWGGAWDGLGKMNRSGVLDDLDHFELIV